ncbi:unnamed protein product [Notodromas monacha]|uniref:Selenoprotein H n=1 Tax=Notodromas monacha TaxID=399045 RepID=A0A7R9GC20_9CRUS|nr:unnamed protein product [Notodromas monacha]CAG0915547.1 unnamed protein product [Notodromas monacha]
MPRVARKRVVESESKENGAEAIEAEFPGVEIEYNSGKPRKGAFEFVMVDKDGADIELWSGVSLGPPRKLKFPDDAVEMVKKIKEHVD